MNLVAPLLLTSHLFIASFVDAGKVVLKDPNFTLSFDDVEASFCEFFLIVCLFCLHLRVVVSKTFFLSPITHTVTHT